MTNDKFRYYTVDTASVVKAKNKTDAHALASGRRNVPGAVLQQGESIERITALEAKSV